MFDIGQNTAAVVRNTKKTFAIFRSTKPDGKYPHMKIYDPNGLKIPKPSDTKTF